MIPVGSPAIATQGLLNRAPVTLADLGPAQDGYGARLMPLHQVVESMITEGQ
jgi:hypothetical protein